MADDDLYVRVTGRYAMLISGALKVEDLDDEELSRGQLRASDGSFRGRPPKILPTELVQAMRREWMSRAQGKLREALLQHGIGTLVDLATTSIDDGVRLRAAQAIIERTMGKVPDKIEVASEDPVETLFRRILQNPDGLDAPVIHEPSAEEREMLS
jgi:hypothetical protein